MQSIHPSIPALLIAGVTSLALVLSLPAQSPPEAEPWGERPASIAGCDRVRVDGRLGCRVPAFTIADPERELVLVLEDAAISRPEVVLHSRDAQGRWVENVLEATFERIGGSTQVVTRVGQEGLLEIVANDQGELRRWTIDIHAREPEPRFDDVLDQWNQEDDATETLARLDALAAGADDPWLIGKTWELRAEVLATIATEPADHDAAIAAYDQAHAHYESREVSLRCSMLRRRAQLQLAREGHPAAIERTFERMAECEVLGRSHRAVERYLRGQQRFARGEYRDATVLFEGARDDAHALRLTEVELGVAAWLASSYAREQQFDEAHAALDRARERLAQLPSDCERQLGLAGHAATIAIEERRAHWRDDPRPAALHTLEVRLDGDCNASSTVSIQSVLLMAYAAQLWGRSDDAAAWLARLGSASLDRADQLSVASIRADIAMARGDWASTQRAHDDLAALITNDLDDLEMAVQREFVAGQLARARGELDAAAQHLRAAFALQDEQLRRVSPGLSSSRVSAKEAEPGRHLVEVLHEQGNIEEMLCTARLLRNRDLRVVQDAARAATEDRERFAHLLSRARAAEDAYDALDAPFAPFADRDVAKAEAIAAEEALVHALLDATRERARPLPELCDALPQPAADELFVLFHQDSQRRWWIFEWGHDAPVRIHDAGLEDPRRDREGVAARWLEPMRDRLAHVSRLRLLASGATHELVLEALPWDGGTLEERFSVTWGLDLPRPSPVPTAPEQPRRLVLVITEPTTTFTDAPSVAALEALDGAIEAVKERGGETISIQDRGGSTRDIRTFSEGSFLILIGHNEQLEGELAVDNPQCPVWHATDPDLDLEPQLRGIRINGTYFDLDTILTMHPPPVAVLESCATGPVDELSLGGAVGLGHVLAAAGSGQVLVTRMNACVPEAFDFVTALVDATSDHPLDLPRLLRAIREAADPHYVHRVITP